MVEQGIKGREIECAVLGNDHPQASTCGEIVLNSDFYAYDTKYIDDNGATVVVPAAIAPEINDKIREIAIQAYQTLGCAGMARVDVFLTAENDVVINEINTLPFYQHQYVPEAVAGERFRLYRFDHSPDRTGAGTPCCG